MFVKEEEIHKLISALSCDPEALELVRGRKPKDVLLVDVLTRVPQGFKTGLALMGVEAACEMAPEIAEAVKAFDGPGFVLVLRVLETGMVYGIEVKEKLN